MKGFWSDRIALVTSGIGMALMILTAVWRVNPVEGSVTPDFLSGNPFGEQPSSSRASCTSCSES